MGGPPSVPQALNRYAATSVGQPGVAEAVVNTNGINPPAWANLLGGTALIIAGRKVTAKSGYLILEGSAEVVAKAFGVGEGKAAFGIAISPGARFGVRGVTRGNIGLVEYLGNGQFYLKSFDETIDTTGAKFVRFKGDTLLGGARALRTAASLGLTAAIDVGFELYGYSTGTGRWGNPYLSGRQKIGQATAVIVSDLALAGTLAFYGVAWYIAIPVTVGWVIVAEPFVFENIFPGLYEENRKLKPLQTSGG